MVISGNLGGVSDYARFEGFTFPDLNSGKFEIVGKVAANAAIGPDTCTKF